MKCSCYGIVKASAVNAGIDLQLLSQKMSGQHDLSECELFMSIASHSFEDTPAKNLFAHDFRSLGIRDFLDARDQFHVHLAQKPNVFSTAIGLYLIRASDPEA